MAVARQRFVVKVDGRERLVEIADSEDGTLRVSVDGRERVLDLRWLRGGAAPSRSLSSSSSSSSPPSPSLSCSLSLIDGGHVRLIDVDGAASKLTLEVSHPDGEPRTLHAEVADARAVRPAASARGEAAGPVTLRAPIPGKVVKALVKVGDQVSAGQALLVIEAMKMENEVRAPRAARVTALAVTEGAAVETGQDLLSLG
jgi:biotin carboxyl carrier protein